MTLTTLYSQLERAETQLTAERQDKARLNTYLQQLIKEVSRACAEAVGFAGLVTVQHVPPSLLLAD